MLWRGKSARSRDDHAAIVVDWRSWDCAQVVVERYCTRVTPGATLLFIDGYAGTKIMNVEVSQLSNSRILPGPYQVTSLANPSRKDGRAMDIVSQCVSILLPLGHINLLAIYIACGRRYTKTTQFFVLLRTNLWNYPAGQKFRWQWKYAARLAPVSNTYTRNP